ncbi:MAG: phosphatidylethanolamine/phosphatidyl-N-methylethanolamine N-methyltransferase [Candidatus Dependentiae bacterium]|nr:phosphatidylethanolamine/phosphatidyl-N-methylethanolamine N-methyltransferase [Candidatus Dependentiae bacterium]
MRIIKKILAIGCLAAALFAGLYVAVCVVGGSSFVETVIFLGRFIDDPNLVGAVAPSSRLLGEALVAKVVPGIGGVGKRFLEVGPGSGAVTECLVAKLGPNDSLDLVELDPHLAQILREKYKNHPQVTLHQLSITDWRPGEPYDAVVMGIPFNALASSFVEQIWAHVLLLTKSEGVISYFSYLWLPRIKKLFLSKHKRRDFKKIQNHLAEQYRLYGVGTQRVLPNVPPAIVFYLQRSQQIRASAPNLSVEWGMSEDTKLAARHCNGEQSVTGSNPFFNASSGA